MNPMNPYFVFSGYEINKNLGPDPTHSDDTMEEDVVSDVDYDNLMNEPGPDGWDDYSFTEMYYKLEKLLEKRAQQKQEKNLQVENDCLDHDDGDNDDAVDLENLRLRPPPSDIFSFGDESYAFGSPDSPKSSLLSSIDNKETNVNELLIQEDNRNIDNDHQITNEYGAEYCESILLNKQELVSCNNDNIIQNELLNDENQDDVEGKLLHNDTVESESEQKSANNNNNNEELIISDQQINESKQEIDTQSEKLKELEQAIAINEMQFREKQENKIEQDIGDEIVNGLADSNSNQSNGLIDLNDEIVELANVLKNISIEKSISPSHQSVSTSSVSSAIEGSVTMDIINKTYMPGKKSNKRSRSTSKSREGEDEVKPSSNNDNATTSSSIKDLVNQNDCNLMLMKYDTTKYNENDNNNENLNNNNNSNTNESTGANTATPNNKNDIIINNDNNNATNDNNTNGIEKNDNKEVVSSSKLNKNICKTSKISSLPENNYHCEYHRNRLIINQQQQHQQQQHMQQYYNFGYHQPSYYCNCPYCQSYVYQYQQQQQQLYYQSHQIQTFNQVYIYEHPPLLINNNNSNLDDQRWLNTIDINPYYDPATNTYYNPYKRSESGYYLFDYHVRRT